MMTKFFTAFTEADVPVFGMHVSRSEQQQQQQASRYGGQQTAVSNTAAGKVGTDKGGNRSARVTEHVGKEWRRRQRVGGCIELEGADSVGEIGASGIAGNKFVLRASV